LDEVRQSVLELYSVAYVVGFERETSIARRGGEGSARQPPSGKESLGEFFVSRLKP
jgi:hypothetical protein